MCVPECISVHCVYAGAPEVRREYWIPKLELQMAVSSSPCFLTVEPSLYPIYFYFTDKFSESLYFNTELRYWFFPLDFKFQTEYLLFNISTVFVFPSVPQYMMSYMPTLYACRGQWTMQESILSFRHRGPRDQTQVFNFGSKRPYQLRQTVSLCSFGSLYSQDYIKLVLILLPQILNCWNYKCNYKFLADFLSFQDRSVIWAI